MRTIRRGFRLSLLAGAALFFSVSTASAQVTSMGSTGSSGATLGNSLGTTSSGTSSSSSFSGSTSGSSSTGNTSASSTPAATFSVQPPPLLAKISANGFNGPTASRNSGVSSNPLAGYYANPMYSGTATGAFTMGGFGTVANAWSPQTTLTMNNTLNNRNATMPNNMGMSTSSGIRVPRYSTSLRFSVAPTPAEQMRHQLQAIVSNSSALPSNGNIRVVMEGNTVVLRGAVADDEERQLAESILRLSPGIRGLRNELSVSSVTVAAKR